MAEHQGTRLDYFMAAANAAYYAKKDPFSDFITAPEISQIFGELIAVWIIMVTRVMPWSGKFALVEAGPGRGTLMADILRVICKHAPEIYERCEVFLIETSPRLREVQQHILHTYGDKKITWLDSVERLPPLPVVMVANEFLDALPIRQFVYQGDGAWTEHYVLQGKTVQQPVVQMPRSPVFNRSIKVGDVVEVCEAAQGVVATVMKHVCRYGGAALFVDYGFASQVWGDTLQAIRNKKQTSPFEDPGNADLTAHVDFPALKETALQNGGKVYGIQTQGDFLKQLGILLRTKILLDRTSVEQRQEIIQAVNRLIDPAEMGDLFKVMAICHPSLPEPPAFEAIFQKDNGGNVFL